MGFIKDFRDFAIKGNVFDMAIGVIMGGAFGKIVSSLIDNLLNPVIGRIAGGVDFANNYVNISGKDLATGMSYADAKKEADKREAEAKQKALDDVKTREELEKDKKGKEKTGGKK